MRNTTFPRFLTCSLAVIGLAMANISLAQEPAADAPDPEAMLAAKELLSAANMANVFKKTLEASLEMELKRMEQLGLSAAGMTKIKVEMTEFYKETMSWKSLEPEFIKLYATSFTTQELKDISTFYQTPSGKKSLELTPVLTAEGMAISQNRVKDNIANLQGRIMPIIQAEQQKQ